jgi:hypothetical protein
VDDSGSSGNVKPDAVTPRKLFAGPVHYEIPPFQRPYVWTESDQWEPLFEDVAAVAEAALDGDGTETHFLGAIVIQELERERFVDPNRYSVIDGQQRLTTLQVLLDAAQEVLALRDHQLAASVQNFVVNDGPDHAGTSKRFKLWPARADRTAFETVMDNTMTVPPALAEARVVQAHRFFLDRIAEWADAAGADRIAARLEAFIGVLTDRLVVVTIMLEASDKGQLIFETLNDRGTPLLQADLIKNHLLELVERRGGPVDEWNEKYWGDFDEDRWRRQVAQGRNYRSKIDLFLQYWLTATLRDEIPVDAVFHRFSRYAEDQMGDLAAAEAFLVRLRRDADTFDTFTELEPESPVGAFYRRVVEDLGQGVFIPLLLWVSAEGNPVAYDQVRGCLNAVESWVVRRALLRYTNKGVNQLVVALLKDLVGQEAVAGDATKKWLAAQGSDARLWPTDDTLRVTLPSQRLYGMVAASKLTSILLAVELAMRTNKTEQINSSGLQVEHVMPQGWRSYWFPDADPETAAARDKRIHTLGNLTLVTGGLNQTLSNRPWTDEAAAALGGAKFPGKGKRSLLADFSLLTLSKDIINRDVWTDDDIDARGHVLTDRIIARWPGPPNTASDEV